MPDPLATVAQELLSRFRRQKPLRGGSLIVTLFGDALVPRGGAIALSSLIRLAEPFGLNERLVRTASTRLTQDEWLATKRIGKLSEYRLTSIGHERFSEATQRIYGEPTTPWTGRWNLIVLPALPSIARAKLKKALAWQGFGEVSTNVFAHPEARPGSLDVHHWSFKLPPHALIFNAELTYDSTPAALVAAGWDLVDLAKRYKVFVQRFERALAGSMPKATDPASAFVIRILLIHEYRRLHLRDPLLPQRLLPAAWPGTRAAEVTRELYARVFRPSETFLSEHASLVSEPLPPCAASVMQRFGGIGNTC